MRRSVLIAMAAFAMTAALAGCGKKAEQAQQNTSTTDSLLASNPTEQQNGNLTPQTSYQQQPETQTPPTPAPTKPASKPKPKPAPAKPAPAPSVTLPAGTPFHVVIGTTITSETAQAGDAWTGTLKEAVSVGDAGVIPAGSTVHGVVEGAKGAQKGDRAVLVLQLTSVDFNGQPIEVSGKTDSLIAGSTRTRNVGAVAGGAAAGALLGRAIGGSGKGALIGGLIGGAAATGAVAKSKGYQVEVKEGLEMTFTLTRDSHLKP
ncbi:MAG TPA: hypothetical protein VLV15_02050 [Dongiaceae bacterium]|nr:hypothetical protein [Dongiaceae bacterium]